MITRKIDPREVATAPQPSDETAPPEAQNNAAWGFWLLASAPVWLPFYIGVSVRVVHWMMAGF